MIRALRWVRLVVVLAACIATGVGAYQLAGRAWDGVVQYRSPYLTMPLTASPAGSDVASRTVLVIVDGLRLDASRRMGTLNMLRQYGSDFTLTAPEPSLSYPNWTTVLTGAPPHVSGVVTNWHKGPAGVETILDTARRAGLSTVFVGASDFDTLYGVSEAATASYLRDWQEEYLSDESVDAALDLASTHDPKLIVVHLPDVDEAGHAFGGDSDEYRAAVAKVDRDLGRLVNGLQDGSTVFVVTADHGHIDSGGHGGWDADAVQVPGVFSGPGVVLGTGVGRLSDVAPTVSVLAGVGTPRHSAGLPLSGVVGPWRRQWPVFAQIDAFWLNYEQVVASNVVSLPPSMPGDTHTQGTAAKIEAARMAVERQERLPVALAVLGVCLAVLAVVAISSRQALGASAAGVAAYYVVYNGLFFLLHGNRWSLSSFNSEEFVGAWMNQRLSEAAVALLVGAAVAALVYPMLRHFPKGPRGAYLAGWLTLGPVTALMVLATLGVQAAWFYWWWGIDAVWRLPDLIWGFKFDLDLMQMAAVGLAAAVTPLVTFVVGRYHPKVRTSSIQE